MMFHMSKILYCMFIVFVSCTETSTSANTLLFSHSVTSNETLVSSGKQFKLGFFKTGNSAKYFLGIWYNSSPDQIVWIANRVDPLNDTSSVLTIGDDGNLILLDKTQRTLWSTELQNISSENMVAQLLDSGNLVLRDNEDGSIHWQSFDHPSHALIAGMKLGWDLTTNLNRNLTSWKSSDDPSPGEYTYGIDLLGLPQIFIWKNSTKWYRSGPWNGVYFGGLGFDSNNPFATKVIINREYAYYETSLRNSSSSVISAISTSGKLQISILHDNNTNDWSEWLEIPSDPCGDYGYCGTNSICVVGAAQRCSCMIGYVPKYSHEWDDHLWSNGCIRNNPANCQERGEFLELEGMKMPDFLEFRVNISMVMEECKAECLKNCSCNAYANSDATGAGHGCLLWYGDLVDVRLMNVYPNQKLYIRATASDLNLKKKKKKKKILIISMVTISALILLLSVAVLLFIWKRKSCQKGEEQSSQVRNDENLELPLLDIITIVEATQDFSDMNKIGEGGFGPVYKGKLSNGQEIAVKRLSEKSCQGTNEFKNEVTLIAKLQHRNLVRLLGCCIHGDERMLIYEYMSNGSLDSYIFGGSKNTNSRLLVWSRRFDIIVGIARGLLYLHRDSRLRIIHRDLKASNVLLDNEMNPKISDFGMARAFGEGQLKTKTKRVVGTYGYMSPEYAIDGIYSIKSDVFSFGVLLLEIVSGKRNSQFHHPDHDFNLLGHAWQLMLEGRASDLIDPLMEDSFPMSEVLRCIQVGLLCVQQRPDDRPTMSYVVSMLDSESVMLPQPKRPGFFTERYFDESDSLLAGGWTSEDVTSTTIEGR